MWPFKRRLKEVYNVATAPDEDFRSLLVLPRDLDQWTHRKQLEYAYKMSVRNPMANRILKVIKDHVVGGGIKYEAEDERVKEVLDRFWNDPVNLMNMRQHDFVYELGLYGEQCYQVFVDKRNGRVRLGYIDPEDIDAVIVNEENCLIVEKVKVKKKDGQIVEINVIQLDEDPRSETFGRLVGDCFFFAINKVSNATRGRSDLIALIDWLHAQDKYLFALLERAVYLNNYVWKVKVEGATKKQLDDLAKHFTPPEAGGSLFYNERMDFDLIVPKLEAREQANIATLFKNHILGGIGLPNFFFAEGDLTTRATALMMGDPTYKMLRARQDYFKYMLEHIFNFVIDQAIIAGTLAKDVNRSFQLLMPEITTRDLNKVAQTIQLATTSLSLAQQNGWVSSVEAANIFRHLISALGIRLKSKPIEKEYEEEKESLEELSARLKEVG